MFRCGLFILCFIFTAMVGWGQKNAIQPIKVLSKESAALPAAGKANKTVLQAELQRRAAVQSIYWNKQKFNSFVDKVLNFWRKKHHPKAQFNASLSADLKQQIQASYDEVMALREKYFDPSYHHPILNIAFTPSKTESVVSLQENKMILFFLKNLLKKMDWILGHPQYGHDKLAVLHANEAVDYLATRLSKEKLVMLGEVHYFASVQCYVADLILALKQKNPGRRIVVFSEFVNLPKEKKENFQTLSTYYRMTEKEKISSITMESGEDIDYAVFLFWRLLNNEIEVYPLEDPQQLALFKKELPKENNISVFTLTQRNKSWARIIENKMAEIRRTDPDALFLVYAGLGHTSWAVPLSLPKFFAEEHPVAVEVTQNYMSKYSVIFSVWGVKDPFFQSCGNVPALHYWKGPDARQWGKQTGFDYSLVVPRM